MKLSELADTTTHSEKEREREREGERERERERERIVLVEYNAALSQIIKFQEGLHISRVGDERRGSHSHVEIPKRK